MPSAVALSILIHATLFLLAGMLVVFTVVKKEEKKFVPPKAVERPKMKLRKPKVKVKKTSKPKPTTRIVTKVRRASMPDIQLPEISGMTTGLEGGTDGFDLMPDLGEVSVFGEGQSVGNDFVGTFYDLKRDRTGRPIPMSWDTLLRVMKDFVRDGWKPSSLSRYYHSPKKLYTTTFAIPAMLSSLAPAAFDEADTQGYFWVVYYTGQLVHPERITFRFRGIADDILVVRVDGEIVLSACIKVGNVDFSRDITPHWQSNSADSRKYGFEVGDWITLEPGVPLDMEVIIGEIPGGAFSSLLAVEVKGEEYKRNIRGAPIYPIFKTAELSRDLHESIHANLVEGILNLTNGPVFCDYDTAAKATALNPGRIDGSTDGNPPSDKGAPVDGIRTWTMTNGRTLEGGFMVVIGDKAVLKDLRGKQLKIPLAQLSEQDREFIELARPPKFDINFSKKSSQRTVTPSPESPDWPVPKMLDYVFSATLKQTSAGLYNHELKVEFFAIGEEIDGDNYILLDHQESTFTPTRANNQSSTLSGDSVMLIDYRLHDGATNRRGEKYGGYLVVVTDERGVIIDHASPHKWIFPKLGNLRKVPIGKHFDKSCTRVFPPRPKREY